MILLYTLLVAGLGLLASTFYLLIRNELVYDFLCQIIDLEYERAQEAIKQGMPFKHKHLDNKYSYDKLLYSFKPLSLKHWFTKREIDYLTIPRKR